jgi:TonB-linked SusC/RagA family outer membrane protein
MIKLRKKRTLLAALTLLLSVCAFAQTQTVQGKVTNRKGEAIPGVYVLQDSTKNATATDLNGAYTITVTGNKPVLVFRMLGMLTKRLPVNGAEMNVVMEDDTKMLKEVVVTALGISKEKKALGYGVSEVSGEDINRAGETNVIESLSSKAAGIQVTGSGGTPGASSKIVIRGNSTFNGNNQPLIVIDGVPVDNSTSATNAGDNPFNATLSGVSNSNRALDINPDDIESVTILKGPAAAALYGARAGSGAIVYTTKKGNYKGGKGFGITYSTNVTLEKVNKLPETQSKYAQGIWYDATQDSSLFITGDPGPDNTWNTNDDVDFGTSQTWGPEISKLGMTAYDNNDAFFRTGVTTNNNVAVSGGDERTFYRFSYGNTNNKGIMPNTWLKRNTFLLSGERKVSEKLKVGTVLNYANTRSQKPQNGSNLAGVMLGLMRMPASFNIEPYEYDNGFNRTYFGLYDNPLYTLYANPFNDNVNRFYGNTYLNYDACKWFNVTYRLGSDFYNDDRRQVYAVSSNGDDNTAGYGQISFEQINSLQVYSDLIATGKKDFGENFHGTLSLGNNIWHKRFAEQFSRGRNLGIAEFYNLSNAAELYASQYSENIRTYAFFFDGSIDYKSAIFLNFTGRNEWSSTFDASKDGFFYPSVSTSVVLNELMTLPKWFNFAKIRAAYAQSGISPEPYRNRTYYGLTTTTDGFTNGNSFPYLGTAGYGISSLLGAADLKPERVIGNEIGIDVRFFDARLTLDATLYNQKTVDILVKRPVAPSSGFQQSYENSGEMENKGIELQLTGTPVKRDKFSWEIGVNWAKNKSKVLKLVDGVDELLIEEGFESIGAYAIVGQPYGVLYGTAWQRTDDGKLIIDPSTGLPYIDPKTQALGSSLPDWIGGIRNSFTYTNWTFSFLWDIRKGGKIWNGTKMRLDRLGRSGDSEAREETYTIEGVLATGVDADGYAIAGGDANNVAIDAQTYFQQYRGDLGGASEMAIEDGGWVRLRDVSLAYRWKMKENKYIQHLDFSVSGRNVLLFTKYTGVDPETSLTGAGSNINGFDYFNNPGTKSVMFGIKAAF